MKVFSLGTCCELTFVIKKFFADQKSGPYDWMSIAEARSVIETLENDFKDFDNINVVNNSLYLRPVGKVGNSEIYNVHGIDYYAMSRRIERFREACRSKEHVLFIMKCHHETASKPYAVNISDEEIIKLDCLIRKIKSDGNFTLIVVRELDERKDPAWLTGTAYVDYIWGETDALNMVVHCDITRDPVWYIRWEEILHDFIIRHNNENCAMKPLRVS